MQTLRDHLNCTLPIELFYYGPEERNAEVIRFVEVRFFPYAALLSTFCTQFVALESSSHGVEGKIPTCDLFLQGAQTEATEF